MKGAVPAVATEAGERFFLSLPSGLERNPLLSTSFSSTAQLSAALACEEDTLNAVLAPTVTGTEGFLSQTLPFFQRLVRDEKSTLFAENRIELVTRSEQRVELSKRQVAWLMGGLFFSLFDPANLATRPAYPAGHQFNMFSLNLLWRRDMRAPLTCIANYMSRIAQVNFLFFFSRHFVFHFQIKGLHGEAPVIFSRFSLPSSVALDSEAPLCRVTILEKQPIEDVANCPLHADFANRFPGGGALDGGCVQEEILFAIKGECLVSMLIVEMLDDNSAFFIEGAGEKNEASLRASFFSRLIFVKRAVL